MEDPLDLKEIESSAFRPYFRDGMYDIFFGLMFILTGLRTIIDEPAISLLIIVAVLVPVIGKRYITNSRLGHVKFGERRVGGLLRLMALTVVAVVISAVILAIAMTTDHLEARPLVDLVFGAMFIIITAAMGRYFEYPMLVVHGIIFAVMAFSYGQYGDEAGIAAALVGGSISITIGLVSLATFMKRFPALPMEA
jgi:hypothetical protein